MKTVNLFRPLLVLLLTICMPAAQTQGATSSGPRRPKAISSPRASQSTTAPPRQLEEVRSKIKSMVENGELPSVAIAVAKDGKIIWEEAFGWADRERKVKATSHTIYPVASLSKSITATGLMVLAERGLINLDDPVEKYLGTGKVAVYRGRAADLKVKHVLNMTGGIPHYWQYYYPDEQNRPLTLAEQIKRYGIVVFPPGEVFSYSNFSYAVAEQLISAVSRKSLDDFMRTEVFTPLGMNRTSLGTGTGMKGQASTGYDERNERVQISSFEPKGGAGFHSTAHDLLRYGMFHLKNPSDGSKSVLKDATLDAMHEEANPNAPNKMYANGWGVIRTSDGRVSLLSNGAILGGTASLLLVPSESLAVVCLNNATKGNGVTDQAVFEVAGALIPKFGENLSKLIAEVEAREAEQPFQPTPEFTGRWEGEVKTYEGSIPVTLIFDQNGKVYVQLKGQLETILNDVRFGEGALKGRFCGNIPTAEAARLNHQIELELRREGAELYGIARATSTAKRPGFGLPSFIQLKKK